MEDKFKIIVITAEGEVADEAKRIEQLLQAGAWRVHVRKPSMGRRYVENLLENINRQFHSRLTLHDFPELARWFGIGFQLNSRNTTAEGISPLSRSCHSLGELAECTSLNYATLSPIFDSISKEGYRARFDFDSLKIEQFPCEVIALGGVTSERIDVLRQIGFSGAAMLGSVWRNEDGFASTLKWLLMRNGALQFITNGASVEQTIRQASETIAGGCRWVQIRMKDAPTEARREAVAEVRKLLDQTGGTLIVDDDIETAQMPEVNGVHLGQTDMDATEARTILGNDKIIGLTINCEEHLRNAANKPVDYFGIGPFRFTTTKKKLAPVLGLEGYGRMNQLRKELGLSQPYVAIGGITAADVSSLMEAGVPGIAVSGAISAQPDPILATKILIEEINRKKL